MGVEDLRTSLNSGDPPSTEMGQSFACLYREMVLLQLPHDHQRPAGPEAWPFREMIRIMFESPKASTTFSTILARRSSVSMAVTDETHTSSSEED